MKRFVAAFVVLLASPAWADDADTSQMVIDAGRLGVMMDQAQRILGLPDDPPGDDSTDTFEILKSAVRQYDRLQPLACERHLVGTELCGALYIPAWLNETLAPVAGVLRARIDEANDHLPALWTSLCGTLAKDRDPSLCQME